MTELLSALLLLGSSLFMFIAALGLLRFPDLLLRMHAATKATGLAFALCLGAVVLRTPTPEIFLKSALALLFAFGTLPVAAHLLSRTSRPAGDSARRRE
jgi:multicomponent Na+:H+ antiporter subunit G